MEKRAKEPDSRATEGPNPVRPTSAQVLRQLGILLLVIALWAALLVGYLSLTGQGTEPGTPSPQPATAPALPSPTAQAEPPATPEPGPPEPIPTAEPAPAPTDTPPTAEAVGASFSRDILPLFTARCGRCHGNARTEAGLRLISYAEVMAGSAGGPVIVPGSSSTSLLIGQIVSGGMPLGGPRLSEAEIATIRSWVDAGALDN